MTGLDLNHDLFLQSIMDMIVASGLLTVSVLSALWAYSLYKKSNNRDR